MTVASKYLKVRGETYLDAERKARGVLGPETKVHFTKTVRRRGIRGLLGSREVEVYVSRRGTGARDETYRVRRERLRRLGEATDPVKNIYDGVKTLTRLCNHLEEVGVPESLAEGLMLTLKSQVPAHAMNDFPTVKAVLHDLMSRMIRVGDGVHAAGDVAVFVGPTGVGKTTTVAKLATRLKLFHQLDVALITTDTFRVGAVDQVRRYAQALGIRWHVAACCRDLAELAAYYRDKALVLVDTAGLGSSERGWVREMHSAVRDMGRCSTYLLLDAGGHAMNHTDVLRRVAPLRIDNLILTKADEGRVHGQAFEILVFTGLPVSYLTTGQNVPGDIVPAETDALTHLILGRDYADL